LATISSSGSGSVDSGFRKTKRYFSRNSPHGQANHRCDIAVGAPLNTVINGGNSLQSTQAVPSPQNETPKAVTLKGINPPHGENNHRCDIAVGALLNSEPAASATKPAQKTSEYTVQ
jgi:phosphatidylethanolamine-binding protein (PEBP) family uncharacterized protein